MHCFATTQLIDRRIKRLTRKNYKITWHKLLISCSKFQGSFISKNKHLTLNTDLTTLSFPNIFQTIPDVSESYITECFLF